MLLMNFCLCTTMSFCAHQKEGQSNSRYESGAALLIVMGSFFLLVGKMIEPERVPLKASDLVDGTQAKLVLANFSRAVLDASAIILPLGLILWALPRYFAKNSNANVRELDSALNS